VKTSFRTLASVVATTLAFAGGPVLAQDSPLTAPTLELTAALDQEQVPVGGAIGVTVRLRNTSAAPVEIVGVEDGALVEDRAVVSFDVQLDDAPVAHVTRVQGAAEAPRADWRKAMLEPGKTFELKVQLPALTVGAWRITAGYCRNTNRQLVAAPVTAKVVPAANGGTDVEVVMITTHGPMRLRLYPKDALGTCLNFARLITQGATVNGELRPRFYDGLTFHRVIPGFMVQGGCPQGTGMGNPGYNIPAEFNKDAKKEHLSHKPGRLSMARANHPDSAGCQFFICVGAPKHLDGQYTCFGEVTRGLDVAYAIAGAETRNDGQERSTPAEPVRIISVRVVPGPKPAQ
jgi:peptidyl-prolyl cis-trans isomerase B (cyclophilin B)